MERLRISNPSPSAHLMNLLITAGNTLAPIDRVRGLTNVFTGRTGAARRPARPRPRPSRRLAHLAPRRH